LLPDINVINDAGTASSTSIHFLDKLMTMSSGENQALGFLLLMHYLT
jgi:hypothetical protein